MAVVETEITDHVAVVTLNRAEARNALNPELIVGLAHTWRSLAESDKPSLFFRRVHSVRKKRLVFNRFCAA